MTVIKQKVTNTLNLSCIQTNRFKTGVLTLTLTVPQSLPISAYFMILSGLLRRGTETYPTMASINRRLDDLYSSCVEIRTQRVGNNLSLVFSAEMLDEQYVLDHTNLIEGVLEMLSQMILHPRTQNHSFDPTTVAQEIRFVQDSLRAEINNTRLYAALRLSEFMHRNNPDYPTVQQLQEFLPTVDAKTLLDAYHQFLKNAVWQVFYVGSLAPNTIKDLLLKYFSPLPQNTPQVIHPPVAEPSIGEYRSSEKMSVSQGKLALGFRTGVSWGSNSQKIAAAAMLNELFGASPSAKLFMNVREKLSLCYYCSSAYHHDSGIITVNSGIESHNREIAEQAILQQMQELREGKISEAEFHAAKKSLENSYRQLYDNPFGLQAFYGTRELFGRSETIEECRLAFSRVTKDEVIALAKKIECDTVFFVEGTAADHEEEDDDE